MNSVIHRWDHWKQQGGRSRRVHPGLCGSLMLGAILLLGSVTSHAVNLTDIEFNALQGGAFEARLKFDGPPPEPQGYTIDKPARIALDFPGAASKLKQRRYPLAYGNASSAVVLEAGGRTRMVLNLIELVPYEARVEGNVMVVEVGTSAARPFLTEAQAPVVLRGQPDEPVVTADGNRVTDLDFRRGEEGEGRLVLKLSDPRVDINVYEESGRIHVRLTDVALPSQYQRRYDVGDFATPVRSIEATADGTDTLLRIRATGDYEHLAYQADNEYVVSVKPLTRDELEDRRREFAYVGEKLSLNFQDIEVRAVLQLIADFTELNLVASDTVRGNITLRLQNVPWDQALDLVLTTRGLDKRQIGNVLMVAPAAEIAERERQQLEAQRQVQELAPLRSEFIRVSYAEATKVAALVESRGAAGAGARGMLSERGTVIVDERTNSLLVTDTADRIEGIRRLLRQIDTPVRQVQIEARIVRANANYDKALGVRWGAEAIAGDRVVAGARRGDVAATSLLGLPQPGATGVISDLGVTGASGSMAVGFISSDVVLDLELSAMESRGRGEIVSQPKVITGDKEPATIKSGTEIPFPESAASGETTIAFKEAVLALEVTPNITPDNRIILDLKINQDSVGQLVIPTGLGGQIPTIDTTELVTKVLVANGETVVLGGVYNTSDIETISKVPFFGDIPYLGRLFTRTVTETERVETLIFITPRILAEALVE